MASERQQLVELDMEAQRVAEWLQSEEAQVLKEEGPNILDVFDKSAKDRKEIENKLLGIRLRVMRIVPEGSDAFSLGFSFMGMVVRHMNLAMEKRLEEQFPPIDPEQIDAEFAQLSDRPSDSPSELFFQAMMRVPEDQLKDAMKDLIRKLGRPKNEHDPEDWL